MNRDAIIAALQAHADEIRLRGVTRLALFGSTARGDAKRESDVDLLVDIDRRRRFSLVELVELESYLSSILGRHVDITERDAGCRPRIRDAILRDAVDVF
ncbi:MAG: nucleotidyltransferase family protein [Dongiaceae bacterium]